MGCCNSSEIEFNQELNPEPSAKNSSRNPQESQDLKFSKSNFVKKRDGKLLKYYKLLETLGEGGSGIVHKATNKASGDKVAIKVISKKSLLENREEFIQEEIEALKLLDHPNILRVFEIFEEPNNVSFISELCTGGELFDRIASQKSFGENKAAFYISQITSALMNCHSNGIVHRDIKPENILFEDETEDSLLKLIDFGTSMRVSNLDMNARCVGSAFYMAPEVIQRKKYTSKCDIWSCGVLLYIMLCGYPPFTGSSESAILAKINRGVFSFSGPDWANVSREAKSLVSKMLKKDPELRPSASEVYHDNWVQNRVKNLVPDNQLNTQVLKNLVSFKSDMKLQQATLTFLASQLSADSELKELSKHFVALDQNGDGQLSQTELSKVFKTSGLAYKYDFKSILKNCDYNHNGKIDYTEFITATTNWKKKLSKEKLESVFDLYDEDNNGKISIEEIKNFIGAEHQEEAVWNKVIAEVDSDKDGVLDLHEFTSAILKL